MGIKELISSIEKKLPKFYIESGVISSNRQNAKINNLIELLSDLKLDIEEKMDVELVAEKARDGLKLIEELTGRIDTEEFRVLYLKVFV